MQSTSNRKNKRPPQRRWEGSKNGYPKQNPKRRIWKLQKAKNGSRKRKDSEGIKCVKRGLLTIYWQRHRRWWLALLHCYSVNREQPSPFSNCQRASRLTQWWHGKLENGGSNNSVHFRNQSYPWKSDEPCWIELSKTLPTNKEKSPMRRWLRPVLISEAEIEENASELSEIYCDSHHHHIWYWLSTFKYNKLLWLYFGLLQNL